jgi:hypothetical protein
LCRLPAAIRVAKLRHIARAAPRVGGARALARFSACSCPGTWARAGAAATTIGAGRGGACVRTGGIPRGAAGRGSSTPGAAGGQAEVTIGVATAREDETHDRGWNQELTKIHAKTLRASSGLRQTFRDFKH